MFDPNEPKKPEPAPQSDNFEDDNDTGVENDDYLDDEEEENSSVRRDY